MDKINEKAEQVLTKILSTEKTILQVQPLTKKSSYSFLKSQFGFTLIEVMIVLSIIAAVLALGASRIKRKDTNIKSVARHLVVLAKEVRNQARLKNSTYRIVFQLDDKEPSYWVEVGQGRQIRESAEDLKESQDKSDDEKKKKPLFSRDDKFGKKPTRLPKGFYFGLIEIEGNKNPVTTGTEFIYFSPEGFAEPSLIQITDKQKITWTLILNPLTAQVDIAQEAKTLKDLQR